MPFSIFMTRTTSSIVISLCFFSSVFSAPLTRRLLQSSSLQVKDRVSRAYGLLTNATLLSTQEALALLSFLRMGASLDIFSHQALKNVNKTIMNIQPAHLARLSTTDQTTPEHRDQIRADIIRKELSGN